MEEFEAYEPLGDGLFRDGYDIRCCYPLLTVEIKDDKVIFEYETFTVTVSWKNENGKRTDPHWNREYKEEG